MGITYEIILRDFLSFSKKKTQFLPVKKFDRNTVNRRVVKRFDSIYRGLTLLLSDLYRVENRVLSRLKKKTESKKFVEPNAISFYDCGREQSFFPFFPHDATMGCYFF